MHKIVLIGLFFFIGLQCTNGNPADFRVKRQYMGGLGGMGTYSGGGYMGGSVLTPEQIIANRELAINQHRTRQALIASEIANNHAAREAQLINAEANLVAAETSLMGGRDRFGSRFGGLV